MSDIPMMPLPVPTLDSQEFWEGVRRHELLVQRCKSCGTPRHYPRPACFGCGSLDYELVQASGRGTVYSFIIAHQSFHPYFDDKVPYNVVIVELDDFPGVRLASNLVGVSNSEIRVGMAVEVFFEDVTPDNAIYRFRPV